MKDSKNIIKKAKKVMVTRPIDDPIERNRIIAEEKRKLRGRILFWLTLIILAILVFYILSATNLYK